MSYSLVRARCPLAARLHDTSQRVVHKPPTRHSVQTYRWKWTTEAVFNSRAAYSCQQVRQLHLSSPLGLPPAAPKSKDRGPKSEEETQTDFTAMNILSNTPVPTTAVDACMDDGFALDSGLKVTGSGVLLMGGEAFKWTPWTGDGQKNTEGSPVGAKILAGGLRNAKGQWEVDKEAWGILDLVWPKPDLLILGTGYRMIPISPTTRKHINDLGIRVEIQDTRNAAAQFNLLATERGVQQVAAALVPVGKGRVN